MFFSLKLIVHALLGGLMLFQPGPSEHPSEKTGGAEYRLGLALGGLCRSVEPSDREEDPAEDPLASGKGHPCCPPMAIRAPLLPPAFSQIPLPRMTIAFWARKGPREYFKITSLYVPQQPRAPPILA